MIFKRIIDFLVTHILPISSEVSFVANNISDIPIKLIDWSKSWVFSTGFEQFGLIFLLCEKKQRKIILENLKKKLYNIKDP